MMEVRRKGRIETKKGTGKAEGRGGRRRGEEGRRGRWEGEGEGGEEKRGR